ncbi:hypothetical protein Y88_0097 [Novosphingobium nitrogenifigens DSM 19370]|uniref:Uncharacterized protein n=1 Tax=Novosphingobium nitrogenifigens DSM 19370 TaxID=983920 RepID=F1ZBG8_9SPHN|nr:hypothetical protein Y88_0097 [Novosphingobium nitrogenifigens DSM 19370]
MRREGEPVPLCTVDRVQPSCHHERPTREFIGDQKDRHQRHAQPRHRHLRSSRELIEHHTRNRRRPAVPGKPAPPAVRTGSEPDQRRAGQGGNRIIWCKGHFKPQLRGQGGSQNRHDLLSHQGDQLCTGPVVARPEMDGKIERITREIERFQPGGQVQCDPRMPLAKAPQPGREPTGSERGQDRQRQHPAFGIDPAPERRCTQDRKGPAHFPRISPPGRRQAQALPLAHEEIATDHVLKRADLPADRALRQGQFARGRRHTAQTRHGFERLQQPGRRQMASRRRQLIPVWNDFSRNHCLMTRLGKGKS